MEIGIVGVNDEPDFWMHEYVPFTSYTVDSVKGDRLTFQGILKVGWPYGLDFWYTRVSAWADDLCGLGVDGYCPGGEVIRTGSPCDDEEAKERPSEYTNDVCDGKKWTLKILDSETVQIKYEAPSGMFLPSVRSRCVRLRWQLSFFFLRRRISLG